MSTRFHDRPPPLPRLDGLIAQLEEDLDVTGYGLAWLQAMPALRILVSDYTVCAVYSCRQGLREAGYHISEYDRALDDRKGTYLAYVQSVPDGTVPAPHDPPSELQELEYLRRDASAAGFFRALGTAFDSLGVAICAIGGLPVSVIDRFTFKLLLAMSSAMKGRLRVAEQIVLLDNLEAAVAEAGPPSWADWVSDMRNMLVHRPRRLWVGLMQPVMEGGRAESVELEFFLPRSPEWTDVEEWRAATTIRESLLVDSGAETLSGVYQSAVTLVEKMSDALVNVAALRRKHPGVISQPVVQWRPSTLPKTKTAGRFAGYDSHKPPLNLDRLVVSPREERRIRAASVFFRQVRKRTGLTGWGAWPMHAMPAERPPSLHAVHARLRCARTDLGMCEPNRPVW